MTRHRYPPFSQPAQFLMVVSLVLLIWVMMGWAMPDRAWAQVSQQVSQQDRAAIAQTRAMAIQALNTRDFSKVEPYLHPAFTITTVDNRIFRSAKEFEAYWNQQLSGPIKNIAMEVKVDTERQFLTPEIEVAYGEAIATFYFTDGNVGKMPMRWTAVLQKLQDQKLQGKWLLQSVHFSSNLLDNPVLSGAQNLSKIIALVAAVGGFLLGALAFWLRQKKLR